MVERRQDPEPTEGQRGRDDQMLKNIKLDKIDLNDYNPPQRAEGLESLIDSITRD